jgi:hypothetical protein
MGRDIDESILQKIRVALAGKTSHGNPSEIILLGVSARDLVRHCRELIKRGEVDAKLVRRGEVIIPIATGGLRPRGLKAMQDRSALEAASRNSWRKRLRSVSRKTGLRLIELGWKLVAGVALAAMLAVVGLSG